MVPALEQISAHSVLEKENCERKSVNPISYQYTVPNRASKNLRQVTLVKLYLTVNFAVLQQLLQNCTTVNSFSVLQQFTVKTSEHNSVCTVRALECHTVGKLYRSAKTVSTRTRIIKCYRNFKFQIQNNNDGSVTEQQCSHFLVSLF